MNIVVLQGNLIEDVKTYTTKDNVKIVKGVIAVDREYTKKKESDFIPFTILGNLGEYAEKFGKKGSRILIKGSWNRSTYKDNNGNWKESNACLVDRITVFGVMPKEQNEQVEDDQPVKDIADDDLPF